MDEQQQSTEVTTLPAASGGAKAPGIGVIFSGTAGKIIFSAILVAFALISYFKLAELQSRNNGAEMKIQNDLTEKSAEILAVLVIVNGVNGIINALQSVEVGGSGKAGVVVVEGSLQTSAKPAELLAPLSNILNKISNMLLWAMGAVAFEKLLLAISGYVIFKAVIPACMLISVMAILRTRTPNIETIGKILAVTAVICIVVWGAIPLSFALSTEVEKNLRLNNTGSVMERIRDIGKQVETKNEHLSLSSKVKVIEEWLTKQVSNIKDLVNALIKDLIDLIMIFILTNIAIPILTILGLYWFTKYLARVIMGSGRGG